MTVFQIQCLLAYLSYYTIAIDGIWGKKSTEATENFQKDFGGIAVDGVAGADTQKALKHAVAYGMGKNASTDDPSGSQTNTGNAQTGTFWDGIKYFTREEFRCKCGGKYCKGYPHEPDERMVRIADQLRKNLGVPITIVSGLRCKTWNSIQDGVSNSQHMYGEAADIYARGVSQSRVEAELDKIGGVRYHYAIKGSNNVHFDVPKGNR